MAPVHGTHQCFDHFFWSAKPLFSLSSRIWNPPVDISETPDRVLIRMEVACVRPSDFSVTVDKGNLYIRGHRRHRPPGKDEDFHVMEISYGCFERVFRLPDGIVEDGIVASYREGFLDIEIPKGASKGSTIKIPIRKG